MLFFASFDALKREREREKEGKRETVSFVSKHKNLHSKPVLLHKTYSYFYTEGRRMLRAPDVIRVFIPHS